MDADWTEGEPITVVRRKGEFIFGWIGTSGIVAAIVWLILWPPPNVSFGYILQGTLTLYPAVWLIWLVAAHPRFIAWPWGLDVTNWFFRYRIPWTAIRWIQATDEVTIHLTDNRKIKPVVAAWSNYGRLRGNPVQRELQERIEQARRRAAENAAPNAAVTSRLDLHPVPFLALLAGLVRLAWLTNL